VSSSFLYLGIIVVWAFWLVPRWLRRQHGAHRVDVEVDVEFAAEFNPDAEDQDQAAAYSSGAYAEGDLDAEAHYGPARHGPADYGPVPASRSRVLRSRRRLLTMLLLLSAVAGGCTALKVTAWWVCVPPAVLIVVYLLLLHEAAVADAERARYQAGLDAQAWAAQRRAYAEAAAYEAEQTAEIIDISARVGDQLYDQYADATVRAVGD
jgi:hypothetical protein